MRAFPGLFASRAQWFDDLMDLADLSIMMDLVGRLGMIATM